MWEDEVFVDTEHGINTAVRKIRQTLKDDSEKPRFVRTVTGKGYRFIGVLEEVAVPTGIEEKVVTAVPQEDPAPETLLPRELKGARFSSGRMVGAVAVALLCALMLVAFVVHRFRERQTPIQSVAVLPLENLTGDPGQDYVANGITDELTTMLAKNSTLRVTSRTSTMQYKGVQRPLREIARELGVSGIVEGSVSRNGGKTHLNLQLIDAPGDTHVWAESYDRDAQGLMLLPGEAAEAIARRLHRVVPDPPVARYVSPEAHDAYMRGRYLWFTDHTREAGPYFQRATELQPDYALAWSGLAIYYGASAVKGELSPAASFVGMKAASTRALQLDASLPEAHLAAAGTEMAVDWNLKGAEAEAEKAIALNPHFAEAHHLLAKILAAQNRQAEAIAAQRRATEIDPFTRPWALALAYTEARQFDAALRDAKENLVAFPNDDILLWVIHVIYERKGLQAESVEALARSMVLEGSPEKAADLSRAYVRGGYPAVLGWKMEIARHEAETRYVSPVELASLFARMGRKNEALAQLELGYKERATALLWIQDDPAFDSLHEDERYRSLVRRIGLPPAY